MQWIVNHKISRPIDDQFDFIDKELGITMLWLEEPVVEQVSKNGLFSNTLDTKAPSQWLQALSFYWQKFRRKYVYQVWR
ncbi:hypothetical protein [Methylovulum sp.]|uniref:hypothetical protein n=1 Tax=Methylovulum sp. TaxID=1916980 RepID=UPI002614DC2E|nr:hypothetical protein [Methylovulum sp.]MDD2802096.1 hypothetical protein [Methylococcales bacterium]MDD5126416.1 hypothetical protein [Methylovulum sp.]